MEWGHLVVGGGGGGGGGGEYFSILGSTDLGNGIKWNSVINLIRALKPELGSVV